MTIEDRPASRISRRRLAVGTAWAVPVVLAASPAPAFAASPVACPPLRTGGWSETTTGVLDDRPRGWSQGTYTMTTNCDFGTAATVTVTSPAQAVVAGTNYLFSIVLQAQYGWGVRTTTVRTDLDIRVGGTSIATATTQAGGPGTLVQPGNTTPGVYQYGANGVNGQSITLNATYTATANANVSMSFTFTMAKSTNDNDDFKVTPSLIRCTR